MKYQIVRQDRETLSEERIPLDQSGAVVDRLATRIKKSRFTVSADLRSGKTISLPDYRYWEVQVEEPEPEPITHEEIFDCANRILTELGLEKGGDYEILNFAWPDYVEDKTGDFWWVFLKLAVLRQVVEAECRQSPPTS